MAVTLGLYKQFRASDYNPDRIGEEPLLKIRADAARVNVRSIEMEDFGERGHAGVGFAGAELLEVRGHHFLPLLVDGLGLHAGDGFFEVGGFDVADEEAVVAEEEGVVVPAGVAERLEHFGPDGFVFFLVLGEAVLFDFEQEADALHRVLLSYG